MNKALHVLVYVFLGLAAAALWFERELSAKRSELTDRNKLQEEYIAKISRSVEQKQSPKETRVQVMKDTDTTDTALDRAPNENNILDGYNASLEQRDRQAFTVSSGDTDKLRSESFLDSLLVSAQDQRMKLDSTRQALSEMREKLEAEVAELNALKKSAREDKATIAKKNQDIEELETAKKELEDDNKRIKSEVDNLKRRITSLNDEVNTAKEETEAVKEENAKLQEKNAQLVKRLQESIQTTRTVSSAGGATAVDKLAFGDKGEICRVDNNGMFVVVKFADKTMDELKGSDRKGSMPAIEFLVKRNDPDGKPQIVGRIRIRQETTGTNYVICDILGDWEQSPLMVGDVVFAD